MGNLHEGHLSLIDQALSMTDFVVCTLFVNPMQFGAGEDLDSYPRTLDDDREKLQQRGCHCLFAPPVSEIYPDGLEHHTRVSVPVLAKRHCGAGRPGHFDGVATVVTKLFSIVRPDVAIFGEKDYQQLQIIRKVTRDLCLPVTVTSGATLREPNGLAMSSRNGYLSQDEKDRAAVIYRTLQESAAQIRETGAPDFQHIEETATQQIREAGLRPEYVAICDAGTLLPPSAESRHLVVLAAARMGTTRLIDNITV
jgi:pantoate--beta-alanine ligase